MFTGLIESTGTVASVRGRGEGKALSICAPGFSAGLRVGESVAVDGCCLTVEVTEGETFQLFASPETLSRTTLGQRLLGAEVNLERSLALGDRLGGHLVTGHIDALGSIARFDSLGESWLLEVSFPSGLAPFLVEKGSVAVDGISLTTFGVTTDRFRVAVIPETYAKTTLHARRAGDAVNLESDLIGKYVARQAALRQTGDVSRITEDLLRRAGFVSETPLS
jgi:riboflavin synthase